jgi:hypothetical protein
MICILRVGNVGYLIPYHQYLFIFVARIVKVALPSTI